LSILLGSLLSGKLSERHVSEHVPLILGLTLSLVSSSILCGLVLWGEATFPVFLALCVIATFGYGVIAPNAAHGALHPMPEIAGIAGASLGFLQMAGGTFASAMFAYFCDNQSAWSMTGTMMLCAALSLAIYIVRIGPGKTNVSVTLDGQES
jgi:DHA1 family bicyclomycin/chloramphenicol resistance-like MFS transporter